MKKILYLLLFLPYILSAQIGNLEVKNLYIKTKIATPLMMAYSGDTLRQYSEGDSMQFYTNKGYFNFNKPILYRGVSISEPVAGGFANNLYFDTLTSTVVAGYKTLTYTPSAFTHDTALTVNASEGDKLVCTFIYPTPVLISVYPSGLWSFSFYGLISSDAGTTQIGVQYFKRSTLGVETNLFIVWSSDINNITNDWIQFAITQPSFLTDSTDKMGARVYLKTTSVSNKTLTVNIGNGYGCYINTPNRLRHSSLRDLNGDTSYLHVTEQDTTEWNAAYRNIGSGGGFTSGPFLKAPGVPYHIADTAGVGKTALRYDNNGIGSDTGLFAKTILNVAVYGQSENNIGLYGISTNGTAIQAASTNGVGIVTSSSNSYPLVVAGEATSLGFARFYNQSSGDSLIINKDGTLHQYANGSEVLYTTTIGKTSLKNGSDSIILNPASGIRLYGNATVFDDLFFPFSTGTFGTAGYPAFSQDSMYYSFIIDSTTATKCVMYFTIQMPHSWKEGSTIYPHVHYKHETAVGTPTFKMKYKWYPQTGSTQTGYKWLTLNTTTGTTDKTIQMATNSGGISGVGKTISSILVVQVYLSGQTGTGDVHAYQMDIHIEKDALGSNTTTSKN